MKNKYFFLILPMLILIGCGSDDESYDASIENGISSYRFYYMDYPAAAHRVGDNNVDVVYDHGKIVKLIGDVSPLDPNSGYSYIFNKNLFTEVSYSSNTATIQNKSIVNEGEWNKKIVEFTTDGRLKYKIIINDMQPLLRDTIAYFYQQGKLKSFEHHNRRFISKSEIFYNIQSDVDSVVTRFPNYIGPGQPYFDPESQERIVRAFTNYDSTANPFKSFIIFDESFYRSLSAHNYSKWEEFSYDYDGHVIGNSFAEWTFIRENGIINFGL